MFVMVVKLADNKAVRLLGFGGGTVLAALTLAAGRGLFPACDDAVLVAFENLLGNPADDLLAGLATGKLRGKLFLELFDVRH